MKKQVYQIQVTAYNRLQGLNEIQINLVNRAIEAAGNAYAPYSRYHVGAAVLLENGAIVTGNNQENAAYPSGLCAERVAIFYAGSQYPELTATRIAIAAMHDHLIQDEPVTPCGACRQVLFEKEEQGKRSLEVIMFGQHRILIVSSAKDLLPLPFSLEKED